ncbi:hypothetical protein KQ51_00561 [Candidatus Izimaplasma bacterium HR1]|jgi:hypothetical protein|uniref:hypothetical protein n=1 Tax=Candidatus Izimoplasma sp. HR1 TaxID=1541959 RepID=UPI0004F8AC96|nr:hypothetical protein KQ51_00561 [Candidatus Izimaplasma bacterium HR1]
MPWYAIALIIYGILCLFIGLLKPPMIWNMSKFKVMEKMFGKVGLRVFVLVWGAIALVAGLLLR